MSTKNKLHLKKLTCAFLIGISTVSIAQANIFDDIHQGATQFNRLVHRLIDRVEDAREAIFPPRTIRGKIEHWLRGASRTLWTPFR